MAEDVVQEAFCGLYRRWAHLSDPASAPAYLRSAVLNGCRSALRYRARRTGARVAEPAAASAESDALIGEEHRDLPRRSGAVCVAPVPDGVDLDGALVLVDAVDDPVGSASG